MKVIFVFAHPDDESFSSGGTIVQLKKNNATIKLITATKGEAGQTNGICKKEDLGITREKELRSAARILGIDEIFFLGYKDGTLINISKNKIKNKILRILKKEKPYIVITFDKTGGSNHPDHKTISEVSTKAFMEFSKLSKKRVSLYYTAVPQSYLVHYKKSGLEYKVFGEMIGTPDRKITTVIDIKNTYSKKIKALMRHKTQQKDVERYLKRDKFVDLKKEFFRLISESRDILGTVLRKTVIPQSKNDVF